MLWMLYKAQKVKKFLKDRLSSDFMILYWSRFGANLVMDIKNWSGFGPIWINLGHI